MNRINMAATVGDYQSAKLQEKILAFNLKAQEWSAERESIETKTANANANPGYHAENGNRVFDGPQSWIEAGTFVDGAAVLACCDEIRRRRLSLPVEGMRLIDELHAIRDAAMSEWKAHVERLRAELASVEEAAKKEVASLHISESAKSAHVADATATARRAAAVSCPTPETWHNWNPLQLQSHHQALTGELREAVARYI